MGTRAEWVADFLARGGYPSTVDNVRACLAWCRSEFGGRAPIPAVFNLFASTQDMPGATDYNAVGVRNYPDWFSGVDANVATLAQDHVGYQSIRDHLTAGHDASATCAAISASVWGSHPTDAILAEVDNDPANNADAFVGNRPGAVPAPVPVPQPESVVDDMTADELKGVLGQWMAEQTGIVLHVLVGDMPPGTTNVLGTWMQEQTAAAVKAIDDHVDVALAKITAAAGGPAASPAP